MQHVISKYGLIDSLTLLIMNSLMTLGDLKEENIASRLVCFGANGVNTLQGFKFGIKVQVQHQCGSNFIGVHCIVHWTNLAI